MDKGIRAAARSIFVEQNEFRRKGEKFTGAKGNTQFRKEVMCMLMEQFGVTINSAATHYNDAFKFIKGLNAELVSGLGRPEGKNNGGRKKGIVVVAETPAVQSSEPAAATLADGESLLLGIDTVEQEEQDDAEEVAVPRSEYWQEQVEAVSDTAS